MPTVFRRAKARRGSRPVAGSGTTESRPFWEVDALRGVAIVMMVVYHFMYDLYFFNLSDVVFREPFWRIFQRATASTFLFLVGLSLTLSFRRARSRRPSALWTKYLRRGMRIFGWGLVISLVTYFALGPQLYVRFGILHFIGVSVAIAYPFLTRRLLALGTALLIFAAGVLLQGRTFDTPWFFWLGLEPPNHYYVDQFSLIPWFGVVLMGIFAGDTLYPGGVRRFPLPDLSHLGIVAALQSLGRRSLPIYLLHQPVLYALFILAALFLGIGTFSLF